MNNRELYLYLRAKNSGGSTDKGRLFLKLSGAWMEAMKDDE